jgi:hypothetical protein
LLINGTFESLEQDINNKKINKILIIVVPSAGLEPALPKRARILSPLCLPIPPRGPFKKKHWFLIFLTVSDLSATESFFNSF